MRRFTRRPVSVELPDDFASEAPSPEEQAIHEQAYARYRAAMNSLKPRERELVIARVEAQWTAPEIAEHFGFTSVDAARMAVTRAMQRLGTAMKAQTSQR
jgi:RNA polymerase sigma factor (sigma-70 family)